MREGSVSMYYGDGRGKTSLAIGQGIHALGENLKVIMIQFLHHAKNNDAQPLKHLEPEFNVFRFEKQREFIENMDASCVSELKNELKTAFNFSKKVFDTGECDVLILDGVTDAVKFGFISEDELYEVLGKRPSYMDVIVTGENKCEKICEMSDYIYCISTDKKPE